MKRKGEYGSKICVVTIPANIRDKLINMVRIVPRYKGDYFEIEFVYQPKTKIPEFDCTQYLSIDLGLDNFATAITTRETAFIIKDEELNHTIAGGTRRKQNYRVNMISRR